MCRNCLPIADEPTGALDKKTAQFRDLLHRAKKIFGKPAEKVQNNYYYDTVDSNLSRRKITVQILHVTFSVEFSRRKPVTNVPHYNGFDSNIFLPIYLDFLYFFLFFEKNPLVMRSRLW